MARWASHYREIPDAISVNQDVRDRATKLVQTKPIHGKAVDGDGRVEALRTILLDFFDGEVGFNDAARRIEQELPRIESPHRHDNQTFSKDWAERLVRTQGNRFYNQSTMEILIERGEHECHIPRSPDQVRGSQCTRHLAGSTADLRSLLEYVEQRYDHANYDTPPTVPGHPNCTHCVMPVDETE